MAWRIAGEKVERAWIELRPVDRHREHDPDRKEHPHHPEQDLARARQAHHHHLFTHLPFRYQPERPRATLPEEEGKMAAASEAFAWSAAQNSAVRLSEPMYALVSCGALSGQREVA